jgi:hypothetical protein
MRTIRFLLFALVVLVFSPAAAIADGQHAVDPQAIAAAVAGHANAQQADRDAVQKALALPQVRDLATKAGLDAERASNVAATLTGDDLERAATLARQVTDTLSGGASTIEISSATIIIVLLLILLIIVALK